MSPKESQEINSILSICKKIPAHRVAVLRELSLLVRNAYIYSFENGPITCGYPHSEDQWSPSAAPQVHPLSMTHSVLHEMLSVDKTQLPREKTPFKFCESRRKWEKFIFSPHIPKWHGASEIEADKNLCTYSLHRQLWPTDDILGPMVYVPGRKGKASFSFSGLMNPVQMRRHPLTHYDKDNKTGDSGFAGCIGEEISSTENIRDDWVE